jgi:anaerobic selenocysteine-containing dehydrogenase
MSIPNASPACREPSSPPVRSARRRAVTVAAMLALATTFILAGAPAAFAAPASTNNYTSYAAGGPNSGCEPHCSWPCSLPCGNCACGRGRA